MLFTVPLFLSVSEQEHCLGKAAPSVVASSVVVASFVVVASSVVVECIVVESTVGVVPVLESTGAAPESVVGVVVDSFGWSSVETGHCLSVWSSIC